MECKTVTVDAVGRCEASPELAMVEAVVIGEGESASDARAITKDRASTLRESISAVSTDRVRTVEIQVRDTDEMFEPVTDAPFQATERLQIDCVPETAESVVVDVTNAGGQIQTVEFQLHEDKRRDLQNKAITSAMERAREKAEQIAAAEGLTVAELQKAMAKEGGTGFESIVDEALAFNLNTDLYPTPVTVSAGVEVVYELSE